jgi:hypothetical protein
MLFTSCQNEETDITNPNTEETFDDSSALAQSILNTVTLDCSFDNILDSANCISVNLPVTIEVNGITLTIESVEDFDELEDILDALDTDDDNIVFEYPITITLSNYEQVIINNDEELASFVDDCFGENEEDDDIECIDFQYPITISTFNSNFDFIETIEINDDEELYNFINSLEGGVLASINFPVTMVLADGSTIEVNNNQELLTAIEEAENACDEDDDNDWNDDDCTEESIELALKECFWEITSYNGDDVFNDYYINFDPNYGFVVINPEGNTVHDGTWSVLEEEGDFVISLSIDWEDLGGEWTVVNCDDDHEFNLVNGEVTMQIEQDCDYNNNPSGCSEEQLDAYLMECHWVATSYNGDDQLVDFDIYFNESMGLVVQGQGATFEGVWSTSEDPTTGVYLDISQLMGGTPEDLNNQWQVVECTEEQIILLGSTNNVELVLNRDCETTNSCSLEQVEMYLDTCVWSVVNLNGDDNLLNFNLAFQDNADIEIIDTNDGNQYSGFWDVTEATPGEIVLELANIAGPNIQAISGYWNLVDCDSDRLEFVNDDNQTMVLEQLPCYSETELFNAITECDWTVYSFINQGIDQTSIYADQTLTFHENGFVYAVEGETVNYGSLSAETTSIEQLVVLFAMYGTSSGLGGYYTVTSITNDYIIFEINGGTFLKLEKACNNSTDEDVTEIQNWLNNGDWEITYSTMDNQDNTSDYSGIMFDFSSGANITADNNGTVTELQGDVVRDEIGNLRYVINYLGLFPYWQMDGSWYITEVDANRIELHHVNDDANNEFVLVFEKIQ